MVLEVTEVESIERKERDGRGKGNEGFPEHSTHFSLSLSLFLLEANNTDLSTLDATRGNEI